MVGDTYAYLLFAAFAAAQSSAVRKRWNSPLIRGNDWFLGAQVGPDFFAGPGRRLMRTFRLWTFAPYAVEAVAAAAILTLGRPVQLLYLAVAMTFIVVVNGVIASIVCTRWARPYEVGDATRPAAGMALPLITRRIGDYTNRGLEWMLAAVNLAAIGGVVWLYRGAPWSEWRELGAKPVLLLYGQIGLLLAKRALVAWRTAAPADCAEEYLAWKEHSRRFWTGVCDSVRMLCAGEFALFALNRAIELAAPALVGTSLAMMAVWMVWYARRRDAYLEMARRTRPAALPVIDEEDEPDAFVCYRPAYPALLLRTENGYSLNLASRRAQVGALYFAGLAAIVTVWGGR